MDTAKSFLFFRHAGSRAKMVINRLSAARSFTFYHVRMQVQRRHGFGIAVRKKLPMRRGNNFSARGIIQMKLVRFKA